MKSIEENGYFLRAVVDYEFEGLYNFIFDNPDNTFGASGELDGGGSRVERFQPSFAVMQDDQSFTEDGRGGGAVKFTWNFYLSETEDLSDLGDPVQLKNFFLEPIDMDGQNISFNDKTTFERLSNTQATPPCIKNESIL